MLNVNQGTRVPSVELDRLLARYGRAKYNIDGDLLRSDIERLNGPLASGQKMATNTKLSLKNTIRYLECLSKRASKGTLAINIEVSSTNKGVRAVGVPLNLQKVHEFGIQATDYILLQQDTMVEVNFVEALNLVAFEMCHDDMGMNWPQMEELLKGYSTIYTHKAEGLEFVDKDEFRKDMSMLIGESAYKISSKTMGDYFGTAIGDTRVYRDALMCSGYNFGSIMLYNILYELQRRKIDGVKIAAQYEDSLMFVVDWQSVEAMKQVASEHLTVTMQGRKFEVAPDIRL